MMDITKSRSDFEVWVVTWWPQSKTMIAEKFDDGGYWNMPLQQYFEAWKAARESLVVDVDWPEANDDFWKDGDEGAYASGHTDGRQQTTDAVVKALRTAGIRIKGESE
ncbi:hypothetical protein J8Z86_08330 [Yersinia enterocolitica]|uniref:hypothetical protein n=1 Tax=Yersinia enterocolitica TaxID=630 RepID=UPI001C8DBE5C|nr:hypothetical protein [Yersinia enterocolitica]MBX9496082.1 hypothetical protein [Yersinia enterocolitica]